MKHDIVIKNTRIVDGTGAPAFHSDIAIDDNNIAAIGRGLSGARSIDADGLTATPGFIDIHTHSDAAIWREPEAKNYIYQGVTTMLAGNCGLSFDSIYSPERITTGDDAAFTRAMDALDALPIANNIAMLVGHGALRAAAVGMEDVKLSEGDHAKLANLLTSALEAGAWGMSSGLIYDPGIFSTPDEIGRLLKVVGKYGGLYSTHMRNESDLMVDAFLEAIEAVRGTGAQLEISHLKASGRQNFGMTKTLLDLMSYYRRFGIDVTCDAYPEIYCHTGLASCLPTWTRTRGHAGFIDMMRDKDLRAKLIYELAHPALDWENILRDCTAEDTIITESSAYPGYQNMTLAQVAAEMRLHPWEATIALCEGDWNIGIIAGGVSEEENLSIFTHPLAMICSDGAVVPQDVTHNPHPRYYRSFVKPIYDFVEKRGLLSLEEAVRKMTSMPAQKIGLYDRGIIRPGMRADVALFDISAVASESTYADPKHYARGIEYLFVSGALTIESGAYNGALAGKLLRRGRD